jgi:glucose/arabinose dehydrogenase
MRWLLRIVLALGLLLIAAFLACSLLPERLAVNAPILNSLFGWGATPPAEDAFGGRIRAADGFEVGLYAAVPKARFLRPTPAGDLLVSVPREGRIVRLVRDADGDGRPDGQETLLAGLDNPHGIDLHDGWLYVGEGSAVARVRFDVASGRVSGEPERIVSGLPEGGNHWTRTVRVGPDGFLYVSVGSSCNVCIEEDERRAALLRFRLDGSGAEVYARGLRNAVGFDWRPGTGELFATDNGRDLLGDDFPPCELNRVVRGGDYGWPFANGDRQLDPDFGAGHEARAAASIPPAHGFAAHNAPLGIVFLRGAALPEGYRGAALVALHGSWNRTRKDGYQVVSLHWEPDGTIREEDFLVGFLEDENVIGRPVDVAEGPDGTIFVSDDYAGAVYRVTRTGAAATARTGGGAASGGSDPGSGGSDPLAALDAEQRSVRAARGAAHWEALGCAGCHVPEQAAPGVVPVALRELGRRHDLAGLTGFLATPTPPMPAVALREDDRADLAVYVLDRFR